MDAADLLEARRVAEAPAAVETLNAVFWRELSELDVGLNSSG
jgi:hypothetical protein